MVGHKSWGDTRSLTLRLGVFCMLVVCCWKWTTKNVPRNSQKLVWISLKTVLTSPQRLKLSVFQIVFPRKRLCMWFHSKHNQYDWSGLLHGRCRWETSPSDTNIHLNASSHMTHKSTNGYHYLNRLHQRQYFLDSCPVCGNPFYDRLS